MNEKESLIAQQRQLFTLEKLLNKEIISLEDLDEFLPAFFHINSLEDSSLIFCGKNACDYLHIERDELMPYSAEQLAQLVTEETLTHITPRFVDFYKEEDRFKVFSSFQQIRQRGKEGYVWVYTATKIHQRLNAPISISIPITQMGQIAQRMTGLLEDNLFMRSHYQQFASLTKREREIMTRVAKGERRKDTAENLHISLHTYDTHRKNIRTKLELKSFSDLILYARAFGLID